MGSWIQEPPDNDPARVHRSTMFVFATIVGMLALNVPASIYGWGWKSAAFNTGLMLSLFVVWIVRHQDRRLLGWLVLGVLGGFTELVADWWLVHRTGSLVYPVDEPHLLASPAYMPFAWALILVQMGAVAHWLKDRLALPWAMLAMAVFSGVNIPVYEHLAKGAGWWFYQATPMLFAAPYYIILGEALLGPVLVLMARPMDRASLGRAAGLGVVVGLSILVVYWIAWKLVGPCSGALLRVSCRG